MLWGVPFCLIHPQLKLSLHLNPCSCEHLKLLLLDATRTKKIDIDADSKGSQAGVEDSQGSEGPQAGAEDSHDDEGPQAPVLKIPKVMLCTPSCQVVQNLLIVTYLRMI